MRHAHGQPEGLAGLDEAQNRRRLAVLGVRLNVAVRLARERAPPRVVILDKEELVACRGRGWCVNQKRSG
jgi:hypothetical protein